MGELDPKRPMAICCVSGLRGHLATRILKQAGFSDVVNVKGGYELAVRTGLADSSSSASIEWLLPKSLDNTPIGIDPSVPQERPQATRLILDLRIDFRDQDFLRSCAAFCNIPPNGSAMKLPPKNSMPSPAAPAGFSNPTRLALAT